MDAKAQSMFAAMLEVVIGVWIMLVPAFTSVTGGALTSTLITGGVVALAGLVQLFWENIIPSWVDGIAAVWLMVSAYVFDVSTAVTWNLVLAGVVAFLIALWDGMEVRELQQSHNQQRT